MTRPVRPLRPVRLRRLARDRRGAATIEFAMWTSLFFVGMLTALDFGMWRTYQLRLSSAVEQGSMMAFKNRATLDAGTASSIATYVSAAARIRGASVTTTATCANGAVMGPCAAPAGRQCACLSGTTPTYVAATCGATCGDSTTAGYYMTISATVPYHAVVLPDAVLDGKTMADKLTVRLQ